MSLVDREVNTPWTSACLFRVIESAFYCAIKWGSWPSYAPQFRRHQEPPIASGGSTMARPESFLLLLQTGELDSLQFWLSLIEFEAIKQFRGEKW